MDSALPLVQGSRHWCFQRSSIFCVSESFIDGHRGLMPPLPEAPGDTEAICLRFLGEPGLDLTPFLLTIFSHLITFCHFWYPNRQTKPETRDQLEAFGGSGDAALRAAQKAQHVHAAAPSDPRRVREISFVCPGCLGMFGSRMFAPSFPESSVDRKSGYAWGDAEAWEGEGCWLDHDSRTCHVGCGDRI